MSFPRQSWFKMPREILVKTTKSLLFWHCITLLAVCTRRLKSSGTLPYWDASPGRIASPASFGKIMLMIWFVLTIWFHIKQWFYSVDACSLGTGFLNFFIYWFPFHCLFLCWFPTSIMIVFSSCLRLFEWMFVHPVASMIAVRAQTRNGRPCA